MKKSTIILLSAILVFLDGLVMCFGLWQGGVSETLQSKWMYFLILPLLLIFTILGHIKESKSLDLVSYAKNVFWNGEIKEDRKLSLDVIRAMAVVMVLLTHISAYQLNEVTVPWQHVFLSVCTSLGMICNTLYIMISGNLALSSKKEEKVYKYYYGRFVSVILPFIICYLVMLFFYGWMDITKPDTIWQGIKYVFSGPTLVAPHYWIIYVFIGLYLTVPLIKKWITSLSNRNLKILSAVIIISEFGVTIFNYINRGNVLLIDFIEWEGIFILGYVAVERREIFNSKILTVCVALSLLLLTVVPCFLPGLLGYMTNISPIGVCISLGLIIAITGKEESIRKKPHILTRMLSKYSYGIILLHWWTIFVFVVVHICQPKDYYCVGGVAGTLLASVITCFGVAFLFENTVNISIRYIFKNKNP